MQVGAIIYDTQSGLGILAKSFFDAGVIDRVFVRPHPRYERHPEWYPNSKTFTTKTAASFLAGLDVLLLFENAWEEWPLVKLARRQGTKIVMMPMYEYTPYPPPVQADLYLCPSLLDLQFYDKWNARFIPVPVDVKWRKRERAEVFIHNAGHGGANYRNGTPELLEAMKYVKSSVRLIVRGQPGEHRIKSLFSQCSGDSRVEFVLDDVPADELWEEGDVFVFPETFNGLSLPLQEAFASGMLVMASNRFPVNTWLPEDPLIPVSRYVTDHIAVEFSKAVVCPRDIAATIDKWYGKDITPYSESGAEWAAMHSWHALKPSYMEALESVL